MGTVTIGVATSMGFPMTQDHCDNFVLAVQYQQVTGVTITGGPVCTLNAVSSTGCRVVVGLTNAAEAQDYFQQVANSATADAVVSMLSLPCGKSTVTFKVGGLPNRVFNSLDLPSLRCPGRKLRL